MMYKFEVYDALGRNDVCCLEQSKEVMWKGKREEPRSTLFQLRHAGETETGVNIGPFILPDVVWPDSQIWLP